MTTALYRRYRPETFAEVIGQDHVTAPLRAALRSGQVAHAYLFSGPRGCGKTSSARIFARVINCEQNTPEHPTDTPCGACASCVELATGGPGSLDVVEIDAASHGGVDDARELRERATFAPARDRYKVFILDEAHMVSNQGFNALLKIVEEPPPHVKFVFATTEPDKVIGTIRSRTHHYPFRLVPPDVLVPYLAHVCEAEDVAVGAGVLPLVVRAGAGSVRDSLSVLDQLIAGAGPDGLVYEGAVALLGYTPASLLDDLVDAIAARDAATAFGVVAKVIATGHEPRRFVEDLLERLRDLIVIAAAGPAAAAALGAVPADQLERMRAQAGHLGASELSRSADLANATLTEMAGATSPRLHLELLMARLLLPAADDGAAGFGARLDRLERGGVVAGAAVPGVPSAPSAARQAAASAPAPAPAPEASPVPASAQVATPVPAPAPEATPVPASARVARSAPVHRPAPAADERAAVPASAAEPVTDAAPEPVPAATAAPALVPSSSGVSATETEVLRRRWPEVLETLKGLRRISWILVGQNAQVQQLDGGVLRLAFPSAGLVERFRDHAEVVGRAVHETLGFDVRVEGVVGGATAAHAEASAVAPADPPPVDPASAAASWQAPAPRPARGGPSPADGDSPPADGGPPPAHSRVPAADAPAGDPGGEGLDDEVARDEPPWDSEPPSPAVARQVTASSGAAKARAAQADATRTGAGQPRGARPAARPAATSNRRPDDEPDEPSPDDREVSSSGLLGAPLVAQMLGGTVIDEQVDDPS